MEPKNLPTQIGSNELTLYQISKTSPLQYWKTTNPKTVLQAFNGAGCSLGALKREAGETVAKAFLTLIVTELIQSFNIGKTMDDIQVVFAVNGIQEDYFYLKSDELKYVFNKAKKGGYGTMYDRIDAAVIFGWIEEFLIERTQICVDQNVEKSKLFKKQEMNPIFERLLKDISKTTPEEKISMELIAPKKRELTEQEEIVQEILKEFDELYEPKEEVFRTVLYNGKYYDVNKFLTLRLEEMNNI